MESSDTRPKIMNFAEIYDISSPLGVVANYPGDRQFSLEWISRIEEGANYNLSALGLSTHAGTHLDAPAHFLKNGKTLDKYPLQRFMIPAKLFLVEDAESIEPSSLEGIDIDEGEALLFKTSNSIRGLMRSRAFSGKFVYLSEAAAQLCVSLGVSLIGIDYLSVDRYRNDSFPVHRCLLENDVLILEGIDLRNVPAGRYLLLCLPLKIERAEAAPARAILLR